MCAQDKLSVYSENEQIEPNSVNKHHLTDTKLPCRSATSRSVETRSLMLAKVPTTWTFPQIWRPLIGTTTSTTPTGKNNKSNPLPLNLSIRPSPILFIGQFRKDARPYSVAECTFPQLTLSKDSKGINNEPKEEIKEIPYVPVVFEPNQVPTRRLTDVTVKTLPYQASTVKKNLESLPLANNIIKNINDSRFSNKESTNLVKNKHGFFVKPFEPSPPKSSINQFELPSSYKIVPFRPIPASASFQSVNIVPLETKASFKLIPFHALISSPTIAPLEPIPYKIGSRKSLPILPFPISYKLIPLRQPAKAKFIFIRPSTAPVFPRKRGLKLVIKRPLKLVLKKPTDIGNQQRRSQFGRATSPQARLRCMQRCHFETNKVGLQSWLRLVVKKPTKLKLVVKKTNEKPRGKLRLVLKQSSSTSEDGLVPGLVNPEAFIKAPIVIPHIEKPEFDQNGIPLPEKAVQHRISAFVRPDEYRFHNTSMKKILKIKKNIKNRLKRPLPEKLEWNGTCLGPMKSLLIHNEMTEGKKVYKEIEYNGERAWVRVKKRVDAYPCIINEIKPWFGLFKRHMHWAEVGKSAMILTKVNVENGRVVENQTLDKFIKSFEVTPQIRNGHKVSEKKVRRREFLKYGSLRNDISRVLAFRMMFHFTSNSNKTIDVKSVTSVEEWDELFSHGVDNFPLEKKDEIMKIREEYLREGKTFWYPIINTDSGNSHTPSARISDEMLVEWFDSRNLTIDEVCNQIMDRSQDVQTYINLLTNKLDSLIRGINKSCLYMGRTIVSRVMHKIDNRMFPQLEETEYYRELDKEWNNLHDRTEAVMEMYCPFGKVTSENHEDYFEIFNWFMKFVESGGQLTEPFPNITLWKKTKPVYRVHSQDFIEDVSDLVDDNGYIVLSDDEERVPTIQPLKSNDFIDDLDDMIDSNGEIIVSERLSSDESSRISSLASSRVSSLSSFISVQDEKDDDSFGLNEYLHDQEVNIVSGFDDLSEQGPDFMSGFDDEWESMTVTKGPKFGSIDDVAKDVEMAVKLIKEDTITVHLPEERFAALPGSFFTKDIYEDELTRDERWAKDAIEMAAETYVFNMIETTSEKMGVKLPQNNFYREFLADNTKVATLTLMSFFRKERERRDKLPEEQRLAEEKEIRDNEKRKREEYLARFARNRNSYSSAPVVQEETKLGESEESEEEKERKEQERKEREEKERKEREEREKEERERKEREEKERKEREERERKEREEKLRLEIEKKAIERQIRDRKRMTRAEERRRQKEYDQWKEQVAVLQKNEAEKKKREEEMKLEEEKRKERKAKELEELKKRIAERKVEEEFKMKELKKNQIKPMMEIKITDINKKSDVSDYKMRWMEKMRKERIEFLKKVEEEWDAYLKNGDKYEMDSIIAAKFPYPIDSDDISIKRWTISVRDAQMDQRQKDRFEQDRRDRDIFCKIFHDRYLANDEVVSHLRDITGIELNEFDEVF